LKAAKGAEAVMLNRSWALPMGNYKPAIERFARRLFQSSFHSTATKTTNKIPL